jgi:adenylate cyclase
MEAEKERTSLNNQFYFDIRIGLHKGRVIAGIVGIKKFAFDIWENTVNIASRMESTSEPGKINVSGETYKLIKADFNCEYWGKVMVKNKGDIDMHFVESKK